MSKLTSAEERVLKKIAESNLITRQELKKFLKDNGSSDKETGIAVDAVTKNLIEKKLVTAINPIGSTCYIITQNGNRFLNGMK